MQKDIFKNKPFLIAEISANHCGNLSLAKKLIDTAKNNGADAVKLQTFTPDTMTLNSDKKDFKIKEGLWKGYNLWNLYDKAQTPYSWHKELFNYSKRKKIICFSTPFDETAVDFLEKLNVPAYKIASFENVHLPLIKKVAKTGKPVIISTGLATKAEIEDAVNALKMGGCSQFALLKCTSAYPAFPKNSNILTIPDLRKNFNCEVGLSDHTLGIGVALAAISHGATIIEKHFTLDRNDGGVDSSFSIEPAEMKTLVEESFNTWQSLGEISYGPTEPEMGGIKLRRSIYVVEDAEAGDKLTKKNLRIIRPGRGLAPKYYESILGSEVKTKIKRGTALKWEMIKKI